jgi:predicted DsbA family dithiol-disulfide isomerase
MRKAADPAVGEVMPRVLVFFDYACQFCYLDWPRLKRLRADHSVELFLVPFELRPDLPPEGLPVAEADKHSERVREHMDRMAAEYGVPLVHARHIPNTHLALALGEFARDRGPVVHEAVHSAIFEAYNGNGEDISDRAVLLNVAERQGLDVVEASRAWDERRFDERLHQFRHLGIQLGITATPAAVICNELLIGSRPYRVLEDALAKCTSPLTTLADSLQADEGDLAGGPPTIDR